jgi:Alpha/beta hydrolase family
MADEYHICGTTKAAIGRPLGCAGSGPFIRAAACVFVGRTSGLTGVLDQGGDRERRVGQREREVGRVEDGEGAPLVVGGQSLGQDGSDDVEAATATTRVHAYRPRPDGPPAVLLTGAGFNASSWYPHVAALAKGGPVYGIDMPGDPNPSVARAPITPPANCAAWLDELVGKLSDRPAHLVGFSYGGWVAMNQAIRAPGRVASITLLDPAGLTKLDARFWFWLSRAIRVPTLPCRP